MVKIIYDSGQAQIQGELAPATDSAINHSLMWRDRSIEYMNHYKAYKSGYQAQDSRRYCYNRRTKSFPTGLLPYVIRVLENHGVKYRLEPSIEWHGAAEKDIPDWAWKHQVELVQTFLKWKRCLIQSPTASGKSTSISLVIDQFPQGKCLIVVPSINLLKNIKKDLEKNLEEDIGMVGGGTEVWHRVTVATGRTLLLHAEGKYKDILKQINVLIFDECHNFGNTTGNTISRACPNACYRLGLSATVTREDGSDLVLEGVIGLRALTIPDEVMVDLQVIHKPQMFFVREPKLNLGLKVSRGGGKPDRNIVYERGIVRNEDRNNRVVDIVETFLAQPQPRGLALILVDRVEHGKLLQEHFLKRGREVPYIWGGSGKERQPTIESFKKGEIECLIASRILNEGEDVPLLELVVNAGGGSGKRGIVQKTGRSLRKDRSGVKTQAIIVDFLDNEPLYLTNNSEARIRNINERHPNCVKRIKFEELVRLLREKENVAQAV